LAALQNIIEYDYPAQFPQLLQDIIKNYGTNDPARVHGANVCLCALIRSFSFFNDDVKPAYQHIINTTFPYVTKLYSYLLTQNTVQFAEMRKVVIKIYWFAVRVR